MKQRNAMQFSVVMSLTLAISSCGTGSEGIAPTVSAHPDLSGTYDVSTLTPLQRPTEFGDNLELTTEQANAILARNEKRVGQRQHNRGTVTTAPPAGGAPPIGSERDGAGNVGGYNHFWVDPGTDVFTVDGKFRTSIIVEPKNGRIPELQEATQQRVAERRRLRQPKDGTAWWLDEDGVGPYDDPELLGISERCILGFTGATPTFPSLYNNYKRIVQTEDYVLILIEMVHDARIVRMNSQHLPAGTGMWLGDSIGWWEGDTLVVDTTNFHPLARPGRRGSVDAHVVEHFSRLDDGNLLYRFTVEDPTVWAEPWTGEYIWRASEEKLYEYACHEGNYSMGGILRGARLLEADKRAGIDSSGAD